MTPVDLATNAFGQNFNVTMTQLAAGFSSLINGGYYYEPHVVKQIQDENGNVIDTGNNDFLREQLKELQADLLDMSDKELVECRSLLLERINWCMTAILERR